MVPRAGGDQAARLPCPRCRPRRLSGVRQDEEAGEGARQGLQGAGEVDLFDQAVGTPPLQPHLRALAGTLSARAIDLVRQRLATVSNSSVFQRIAKAETIGRELPIAFIDDSGAVADVREILR